MKVQKQTNAQGEWAKKGDDIKDGDIVKILDAGQTITGEYGDRLVFKVQTRNGERNLSFNKTSVNNLVDAFGDETTAWKGKEAKIWLIKAMVSGKLQNVVYLAHPKWHMQDDGSFVGTVSSTKLEVEDIPVINEDDMPF
jgi:hypothetical protein